MRSMFIDKMLTSIHNYVSNNLEKLKENKELRTKVFDRARKWISLAELYNNSDDMQVFDFFWKMNEIGFENSLEVLIKNCEESVLITGSENPENPEGLPVLSAHENTGNLYTVSKLISELDAEIVSINMKGRSDIEK